MSVFKRFNFLNGLDCPDWLLIQIAEISKMTTIKYKLLCTLVLNKLSRGCYDEIDLSKYVNETLDEDSILRIMTATSYMISSASASDSSSADFILELEQLGMTSEHSRILSKSMESSHIAPALLKRIARAPTLVQIKSQGKSLMIVDESEKSCQVDITSTQLDELKKEMSRVNTVLSKIPQ